MARWTTSNCPKPFQAIVTNYCGVRVLRIPESHIPDVLARLAEAAECSGKMPRQSGGGI